MFERYDEPARRTLFFARYAASELGSPSIESQHMLLGVIRESEGLAARVLSAIALLDMRAELESTRAPDKVPTSVEIPFSAEAKRAIEFAAEEADRLQHRTIAPEHLLLGLMREEKTLAAATLARYGLRLEETRRRVSELSASSPAQVVLSREAREKLREIIEQLTQLTTMVPSDDDAFLRLAIVQQDLQDLLKSAGGADE